MISTTTASMELSMFSTCATVSRVKVRLATSSISSSAAEMVSWAASLSSAILLMTALKLTGSPKPAS